jgi:hypothetical protein
MAKRAREMARQQKREDKQERQESKVDASPKLSDQEETALLEEFARLNADYAAERVSESHFAEEKQRILVALGIEKEDES